MSMITRLLEEKRYWRKCHPFGFVAKPSKNEDGTLNLMIWDCSVPGIVGTPWADGVFNLRLIFNDDYPSNPPLCKFVPPLFHPNISHVSGTLCIPLLDSSWHSQLTVVDILEVICIVLDNPCLDDILNVEAYTSYRDNRLEYNERIKIQTRRNALNSWLRTIIEDGPIFDL